LRKFQGKIFKINSESALEESKPGSVILKKMTVIYLTPLLGSWLLNQASGRHPGDDPTKGCSGGDCPFHLHPFFRKVWSSSLLLSQRVNSLCVPFNLSASRSPALTGDDLRRPSCLQLPGLSWYK